MARTFLLMGEAGPVVPNEALNNSLTELRQRFSSKDPQALEDEESWWSVGLEQTEQGLK